MAKEKGVELPIINNIIASNDEHINHALKMVKQANVKRVGVVGVTFKSDTDDLRESPALTLMEQLHQCDYDVRHLDPNVDAESLRQAGVSKELSLGGCLDVFSLIRKTDLLIITHNSDYARRVARTARAYIPVIDLVGLEEELKGCDNYQGVCW